MVRRMRGGAGLGISVTIAFRECGIKIVAKGGLPRAAQGLGPGFPNLPRPAGFFEEEVFEAGLVQAG
jgi:hypothetical protein